ncbi:MAG TPA: serpin family protein [Oscillospiraceae bacterium]|nr:serpin family protein [Oscillospiraceae bacterium]HPF57130.1 serpin family protein [Clostridiales bacterium]HPK36297.1 serpin family protein [Oscillospiraceae bacterium]HPR75029.1 serpin family protein [Oscillospiraceae bacterium]
MRKAGIRVFLCFFIAAVLLLNSAGCVRIAAKDLMEGVNQQPVVGKTVDDAFISSSANFAVELFKKTVTQGENSLISPLSVMLALAMTANGADTQTKAEMETLLGGDIPLEELNEYLYTYIQNLPSDEKYKFEIANSIWLKDDDSFEVNPDFLQTNADYYDTAVYMAPFNNQTLSDINNWVRKNTDHMIDKGIDEFNPNAVCCLINAVVFDAKWETKYSKKDVKEDEFCAYDGTVQNVEMMSSEENFYLDDGMATGFIKNYKDGKYSFAALLPNEGVSIDDYIASLTGEGLVTTLTNKSGRGVNVEMPKFTNDYAITMNDALKALGMTAAFDAETADFSKLGTSSYGSIWLDEVLQKTHIEVDENGTKAIAVTFSFSFTTAAGPSRTVKLDRPFVYMIIDNATNLPIFIGTVLGIK